MSRDGNNFSNYKEITICIAVAIVVTLPLAIGMMWYYKLGPFSAKSATSSTESINASKKQAERASYRSVTINVDSFENKHERNNNSNMPTAKKRNQEGKVSAAAASNNRNSITFYDDQCADDNISIEFTEPLEPASFDFEKNTGIQNKKAFVAYTKLLSLSDTERNKMGYETVNALNQNLETIAVVFTNIKNIGIVHVLARYLTTNSPMIDQIIQDKIRNINGGFHPLENLLVELACHIKMRKRGEKVSCREYNEYLFTFDIFVDFEDILRNERNLFEKTMLEASFFNGYVRSRKLFQMSPGTNYAFIRLEFILYVVSIGQSATE